MNKLISQLYQQIYKIWRPHRIRSFISLLCPQNHELLLDVGGCPGFWSNSNLQISRIDALNTYPQDEPPPDQLPHIRTLLGDGCNLPFENGEYDIAFSNSVIEHVGDFSAQRRFADETRRVGKRVWVQTPAFVFPIEPHCLLPFVHWFPWSIRKLFLKISPVVFSWNGDKSEFYETMRTTRILKKSEMQSLFPDCRILTEKFLGIPKCYIAYRTGSVSKKSAN
jgi:hypothetical protein